MKEVVTADFFFVRSTIRIMIKISFKTCHVNYFLQREARKRELLTMSQKHQDNSSDTENDEENDSSIDGDDDNILTFVRSIHADAPALDSRASEA